MTLDNKQVYGLEMLLNITLETLKEERGNKEEDK